MNISNLNHFSGNQEEKLKWLQLCFPSACISLWHEALPSDAVLVPSQ